MGFRGIRRLSDHFDGIIYANVEADLRQRGPILGKRNARLVDPGLECLADAARIG
jgi:hypothetical protein